MSTGNQTSLAAPGSTATSKSERISVGGSDGVAAWEWLRLVLLSGAHSQLQDWPRLSSTKIQDREENRRWLLLGSVGIPRGEDSEGGDWSYLGAIAV